MTEPYNSPDQPALPQPPLFQPGYQPPQPVEVAPSSQPAYQPQPAAYQPPVPAYSPQPAYQPQPDQAAAYPYPPQYAAYAPALQQASARRRWSGLAIAGFIIAAIVLGITLFAGYAIIAALPIILCARAIRDIKLNGKRGMGLAIAGIVLAGVSGAIYVVFLILR